MRGEAFDAAGRALANERDNVRHVSIAFDPAPGDFADDGFHPSEASYQVFGRGVAAQISRCRPPLSDTAPDSSPSIA